MFSDLIKEIIYFKTSSLKLDWDTDLFMIKEQNILIGSDVEDNIRPKIWWGGDNKSTPLESFVRVYAATFTTMVSLTHGAFLQ
jgi:hypothetical protein